MLFVFLFIDTLGIYHALQFPLKFQDTTSLQITSATQTDTASTSNPGLLLNRDNSYLGIVSAYRNMRKAMPTRPAPGSVQALGSRNSNARRSLDASERADQLFPRRPVTSHQAIMKELYVTQSIFDQSKSIPMRQYFTT